MTVLEMAQKYYPQYWSWERLEALKDAGKLTQEQVAQVVNEAGEGGE